MQYEAKVPPEVSRAIGGFGLGREAWLKVLNWLYRELEEGRVDSYRRDPGRRVVADPDRYFWCELTVWERGRPRGFRFIIDDATAPGYMLVVAAEEV